MSVWIITLTGHNGSNSIKIDISIYTHLQNWLGIRRIAVDPPVLILLPKLLTVSSCHTFSPLLLECPPSPFSPEDLPSTISFNMQLDCASSVQSLLQLLVTSFGVASHYLSFGMTFCVYLSPSKLQVCTHSEGILMSVFLEFLTRSSQEKESKNCSYERVLIRIS